MTNNLVLLIIYSVLTLAIFFQKLIFPGSTFTNWTSYVSIACVNLYLFMVLVAAAVKGDKESKQVDKTYKHSNAFTKMIVPGRTAGLFLFLLFSVIIVCGFANLYRDLSPDNFINSIDMNKDNNSLYFSVVTITTVGYGDIVPASSTCKLLVIWELGSGLLLLAAGLGLLISRISMFR